MFTFFSSSAPDHSGQGGIGLLSPLSFPALGMGTSPYPGLFAVACAHTHSLSNLAHPLQAISWLSLGPRGGYACISYLPWELCSRALRGNLGSWESAGVESKGGRGHALDSADFLLHEEVPGQRTKVGSVKCKAQARPLLPGWDQDGARRGHLTCVTNQYP